MLLVSNVLSCVNFRSTNEKIFCSFVSKRKYVFNRYVVASLSQQILDNNVLRIHLNLMNSKFSLTYHLNKLFRFSLFNLIKLTQLIRK